MSYRIYLSPPSQNGQESKALQDVLVSNWLAPVGPAITAFENNLSELHNQLPVRVLNSGTAAIHLALILSGVKRNDTIFVASHTHNATVNPIVYLGATPVFIESESETWNMCPEFLEIALHESEAAGKLPRAIILVHLYGVAAKIEEILAIAKKYGVPVIEDAAETLGATYNGTPLGTFGNFGILSFNGNKIVTSGGGGALIAPNLALADKALFLATQAREDKPYFEHKEIGYNYRMSNVSAALGNAQLYDLPQRVAKRRAIFDAYCTSFNALNERLGAEVVTYTKENTKAHGNRWLSAFQIAPFGGITNESWRLALLEKGIESRPFWKPMHLQPVFKKYTFYGNKVAEDLFKNGLCLPSGTDLTEMQHQEITDIIYTLYQSQKL